ncbi:MAG: PorV/PorQ family protein [Chlorobi bacterium]|nr:PorV/PorQ family protein [Chlorobiota bacterium]
MKNTALFITSHLRVIRWVVPAFLSLIVTLPTLKAQTAGGGSAVPFLQIAPNARYAAMGEAGTAIANDVNATFFNIGGLGFKKHTQVSINYSKWLPQFNADLHYGFLTGSMFIEDLDGTISAHITYLDLGEFQQTFDDGTPGQRFRSQEYAIGAGYSTELSDHLAAGMQGRYIESNLSSVKVADLEGSGVGRSFALDLGLLWKPRTDWSMPEDFLNLGFMLSNLGPKIHYIDIQQADPLPTALRIGVAFHVVEDEFNDLTFTADISKLLINRTDSGRKVDPVPISLVTAWGNGKGVEVSLGTEYWYDEAIALRAGYFTESEVSGNREFLTFGAGVRYQEFGLDFSYINTIEEAHPLANTLRFSLLVDLD